jgi:two-component system, NtrC family, sensor histidine kinase PilS
MRRLRRLRAQGWHDDESQRPSLPRSAVCEQKAVVTLDESSLSDLSTVPETLTQPRPAKKRGSGTRREHRSPKAIAAANAHAETAIRLLRLLGLYRCVVGVALALIAPSADVPGSAYAAAFAYAGWSLISLFLFKQFAGRIGSLLLVQLCIDLAFICFVVVASKTSATAYAVYLFPIAAAHGWFFRNRMAFAHAALATIALMAAEAFTRTVSTATITQAAIIGAGYFLLTAIGMLLGRSALESEKLVVSRSEDVRRLAQVNQIVISELKDGVVVVGAQGQVILANPQARRWLTGDEGAMSQELFLEQISPSLGRRWRDYFQHGSTLDLSPLKITFNNAAEGETGIGTTKTLTPRMMPIDLQERVGTLIFLEDTDAEQAEAQQIKLAALGRLSASIAHEIRNPLSAIKQAAQLIAEEVGDSPQAKSLAAMIDKNTERIDRIVRDVSLLGRRDRGNPSNIVLSEFIAECIAELTPILAAGSGFQLAATKDVIVYADRGHLEEMVNNLLSNAWRHSQKLKGSVRILLAANAETQRAAISVIDDGSGVPKAMMDKIFEPFFSGSGSTGLGLYLVRELAQANGGSVRLGQSSAGARFVLELPIGQRQAPTSISPRVAPRSTSSR